MEENESTVPIQQQHSPLPGAFGEFLVLAILLMSCNSANVKTPEQKPTAGPSTIPATAQVIPTFTSIILPAAAATGTFASFTPVTEATSTPASIKMEIVEEASTVTIVTVVKATKTSTPIAPPAVTPVWGTTSTYTPIAPPAVTASALPTSTYTPIAPPPGQATPEPLWVDPVISPTDQLTQTIVVYIGYGEEVTVTSEAGTFTAQGNFNSYAQPAQIVITLLPNAVNHLEVTARVRIINIGGYRYGGYTLSTRTDRRGNPLVIVQGNAANP